MRIRLPHIEIKNWAGLYTKSSQDVLAPEQLKIADNVDLFESYGALSKLKGSSRVLSSVFNDPVSGTPAKMSWLGFYKAPDLAGAILRHVLIAAGTTIKRLNGSSLEDIPNTSDGSSSTTGRTDGLFHTASRLGKFMFISNINPDKVGEGDRLIKYDGARISNWGVDAPGSEETVREAFDDSTNFSTTNCNVSNETVTTFDGDAVSVTQTSGTVFSIDRTGLNFSVVSDGRTKGFIANRVSVYLFIPRGQLDSANQSNVDSDSNIPRFFSAYFGTDSSNYWRFDFRKGAFVEGWNKINFDFAGAFDNDGPKASQAEFESFPIGTTLGSFDPDPSGSGDNVQFVRFEFEKEAGSDDIENLKLDRLQTVDEGAPVVTRANQSGNFTGAYQYKVSFVSKYGFQSNTGPSSVSTTAANNAGFYLSFIPTSGDNQVVSRRLYRTVANGTIFLFLGEISDNSTATFNDTVADGSLAEVTAPQAGDFSDDNSPPPKGGIVKTWKRTVFMAGDPQNPETLYFSDDDEPESFPLLNAFELDDKITAIYETYSGLVVETETGKWAVIGDNPDFAVDKIIQNMGCVGRRAAGEARLLGYSVDREGLRLFDLSDTSKISEPIRDKYDDDISKTNIELIHTVHSKARNSLLQFNPDDNQNFDSIFHYQYAIDDVRTGWWSEIKPPSSLDFQHATEIEDSNGDFRIYAGGDDGMIYEIITTSSKNWTKSDGSTEAVTTKFQSPWLRLGSLGAQSEGVTGRVLPVFLEVRAEGDATTWKATIDTAEGSGEPTPKDTTSIDMEFGANNTLLRYPVKFGNAQQEEYVRITLENSDKDVESTIKAIRLYFHVRESQDAITAIRS